MGNLFKRKKIPVIKNELILDKIAYRVSILGEQAVGKTSVMSKFLGNKISENYIPSIGIDRSTKTVTVKEGENDKEITIFFIDTAGQERFRAVSGSNINTADGVLVVFDLTSRKSFEKISFWIEQVRKIGGNIPIVLLGNKCDLADKREVKKEEIEDFADKEKFVFYETSAYDGTNIKPAFEKISQLAYDFYKNVNSNEDKKIF